ncbi:MAG TPA: hypothetical protein VFY53_04940 [Rhodoplanes sp.]|nr:hypothetical protein [Rhodoplanes sp.]
MFQVIPDALFAHEPLVRLGAWLFAHVTNQMALVEGDFEKGPADGTVDALAVIVTAAATWRTAAG